MPQAVHPSVVKSAVNVSVRQRRVWLQSKRPPKRNNREEPKKTMKKEPKKNANTIPCDVLLSQHACLGSLGALPKFPPLPRPLLLLLLLFRPPLLLRLRNLGRRRHPDLRRRCGEIIQQLSPFIVKRLRPSRLRYLAQLRAVTGKRVLTWGGFIQPSL